MENTKRLISVGEAISKTNSLTSKGLGLFILISAIYGVLEALINLIPYQFTSPSSIIISITFTVISVLLLPPLFVGILIWAVLKLDKGEKPDLNESFNIALQRLPKLLWTTILQIVFILVGLIFLIIPGIVLGVWFFAAEYLVVEKNLGPWEALMESKKLIHGNFFSVFLLSLIILVFLALVLGISQLLFVNLLGLKILGDFISSTLIILIPTVFGFVVYKSLINLRSA